MLDRRVKYLKSNYCKEKEIRKILESKEKLVYADDGMYEVVIKKSDIPDYIVGYANACGHSVVLKIIDQDRGDYYNPTITTIGWFLDKCHPKTREEIIDRLVLLQTTDEKPKKIPVIDEDLLNKVMNELGIDWEQAFKENINENIEYEY